jgi:hypothetical protein
VNTFFGAFLGWTSNALKRNISYVKYYFTWGPGVSSSQAAKLAEGLGFTSTTFCPVSKWKEQGYQAEPGKKKLLEKRLLVPLMKIYPS